MPLRAGKAKSVIGGNIREMQAAGHPHDQAVAAALSKAFGPRRDDGGMVTGPLLGATDGRADDVKTSVPDGSHIVPADVVGALGEGNSVAGAAKLSKMFPAALKQHAAGIKSMKRPAPMKLPKAGMPHVPNMPKPKMPHLGAKHASGGAAKSVPVQLSDGEFSIAPEHVRKVGEGDMERGHRAIDAWIMHVRHHDIERRKRLPPPVK